MREKYEQKELNFEALEAAKAEKAEEIVYLLDLFDGKLSLSEILNVEVPLLNQLKIAKVNINRELQEKAKKKK